MVSLSFENQGTNTFLVYQLAETDLLDTMSLGMMTNNNIPGFAPASFMQMDTTKYIKYNVSAKVSVSQLFSGPVNKKRLLGVFTGVVDALLSAEDYMLDANSILLDLDYIFADVTTCETELVCIPLMNAQTTAPNVAQFFKNILFTTQFDQTENCDHVAQLINFLNANSMLVLSDFKSLLHNLAHGDTAPVQAAQPVVQQPAVQQPVKPVAQQTVQPTTQQAVNPVSQQVVQQPAKPSVTAVPVPNGAQSIAQRTAAKKQPPIPPVSQNAQAPQVSGTEKPMTLMYLMQHYNKENAAIYKAQQDAKKNKVNQPAAPVKPVPQKKAAPVANAGFAIPNMPASAPSFAVPNQPQQQPVQQATRMETPPVKPQAVSQPVQQPVQQVVQQPVQQAKPINFGETTVLSSAIGETTVLSAATAPGKHDPHLIRSKNNEKIPLNKPVFRIGKERSYVDYFISDNTAISRGHANIVDHNGEFFIVDTNSTNHTYVNGAMIQSGVETKLSHGDKVRLANEEFEFKLC